MAINKDTAIVQAEEQRAQAEALFNSIGEGAIATDEFGRITRINPIALSILGYKESELLGEWFPKKIVALNEQDVAINLIDRPITKAFLSGRSVTEKVFYRKRDGQKLPVMLTVSPILLADRPIGAIEVFRDITLEEEIDRMKSEFISLASHQLRTPLSAIKTYSHMLVDGYMGDVTTAQKKSLRTIIGATNRMNELISTLLNITRIESGTIVINARMLRIDRAAEEVIKELNLAASEKNITLSLTQSGKLATSVKTDNLILKEIISNLISNAIKYTTEGGAVDVIVRGRNKDVLVTVADNGWGIPKDAHDQVFSKFFRAQNTVKRETTGTGLGLYLVKGLLERLNGNIWFESEEGKGTTFFFTLPKEQRLRNN
ncbi:PAS domain S-box protein [Polaromonas sp.]|nr:PAS domain S-box protein [Candidatus Saccharibacteria bacterium]